MQNIKILDEAIPLILSDEYEAKDLLEFIRTGRRFVGLKSIEDQLEALIYSFGGNES
jgi:hypothetical protein